MRLLLLFTIFFSLWARDLDMPTDPKVQELISICESRSSIEYFIQEIDAVEVEQINDKAINDLMSAANCQQGARQKIIEYRNYKLNLKKQSYLISLTSIPDEHLADNYQSLNEVLERFKDFDQRLQSLGIETNSGRVIRQAERRVVRGQLNLLERIDRDIQVAAPFMQVDSLVAMYNQYAQQFGVHSYNRVLAIDSDALRERRRNCTQVNNLNEVVSPNNPRNQYDYGICYAYAAADMVSHRLGQWVSALDIGNAYNNRWYNLRFRTPETELHGGHTDAAIRLAQRRGFCVDGFLLDNATFPLSSYYLDDGSSAEQMKAWQEELEGLKQSAYPDYDRIEILENKLYSLGTTDLDNVNTFRFFETAYENNVSADCVACREEYWNQIGDYLPTLDLEELGQILGNSNRYNFIDHIMEDLLCQERRYLDENIKINELPKSLEAWEQIDASLNSGDLVGYNYHAEILRDSNAEFDEYSGHASTIVGRRFNEETMVCEYLVRNSYGDACTDKYDPRYECSKGHIWIPQPQLHRAMTSIDFFIVPH